MVMEKATQNKQDKAPNNSGKTQVFLRLLMYIIIIISLNIISSFLFTRFDLTSEKRYSISPATKEILSKLDDVVFFKIYLEGEFPAGFKRLRNSSKEMLDEFRAYAHGNIQYELIDPSAGSDNKERNLLYKQLTEKGLQPTNLEEKDKGGSRSKIIFPGALVNFRNKEVAVSFLVNKLGASSEALLNNSVEGLEYQLANAIKQVTAPNRIRIAFSRGHKELGDMQTADIVHTLKEYYDVDTVRMNEQLNSLKPFQAVVIAGPDSAFTDKDKFVIDQYIMKGGKVVWFVDAMTISLDSLGSTGTAMSVNKPLNLDDMFFKYGIRLNPNLIMDLQASPIPVVTGYLGNQPKQELLPWYFFPLITPDSKHPLVNNLNAIHTEFVGSMDTVGSKGIKKTILLNSSRYSRLIYTPARVSLNIMRNEPDPRLYDKPKQAVAVLLEGIFESVFAHRMVGEIASDKNIDFREKSIPNKMIVVSDADIIRNYVNKAGSSIYPLGYDRYTRQTYGNKDFILNSLDYLLSDANLIGTRAKEFKLRLLDHTRVEKEKLKWQLINTLSPILFLTTLGLILIWRRKRKYSK